jgi:hypothetical protein
MSRNGWTEERRARQAEAIRRWKPWEKSTGPASDAGKSRVSRNAYKGARWVQLRLLTKQLNTALREQKTQLCAHRPDGPGSSR